MVKAAYPIRAVAQLTGIGLDTLRAWERRYEAVVPERRDGRRTYSAEQVQRLSVLHQVVNAGHSIGSVAKLSDAELQRLLEGVASKAGSQGSELDFFPSEQAGPLVAGVLKAIEAYDYYAADRELNRLAAGFGNARELVHRVALPLMRTTGERWHDGKFTIAQEHMVTSLLNNLLAAMMRVYSAGSERAARIILATPEGEHHAFGVLTAAMLASAGGLNAVYLGPNLPARDIILATRKTGADAVLLGLCGARRDSLREELTEIASKLNKKAALWVGGGSPEMMESAKAAGWMALPDFRSLERELKTLGARF